MASLLKRLFSRKGNVPPSQSESFATRFHRFKLFLSASIEAYGEILDFEERLADEMPLGMPFLRISTARLTVSAMQCILQLNSLSNGGFAHLNEPFTALRGRIQKSLNRGATPLLGPRIICYDMVGREHTDIVSPNLVKLETIRAEYPEFMPHGFVVSGAVWWEYFNNPVMHDEIDRIMIISQDDPNSYDEAGATIRERMASSFPLPATFEAELRKLLAERYPELDKPGMVMLVRCLPVLPEHGALVIPEQLLRTPVTAEDVLQAIRSSLSMAYRPRSMIFRLKRGIRDRAMPLCVALTLIPEVHARGSVHRKLEGDDKDALLMRVRRGFAVPEAWPSQASVVGAALPEAVQGPLLESARAALDCMKDAPVRGNRHEIFWAASEQGHFYVLGVNALPDPSPPEETTEKADNPPESCLSGGRSTYPGKVQGRIFSVRNFTDALAFPIGGILALQQASPRWSFLLDFASGAVAGDGTGNGLFARTARRYGRPTILGQPEAFDKFDAGFSVRLEANTDSEPRICPLDGTAAMDPSKEEPQPATDNKAQDSGVPGAAWPGGALAASGAQTLTWLPHSDLAEIARELAPQVVPVTLPDSDNVDFRAENCRTFNDFLSYCHVHAVREMFRAGTQRKSAQSPAKQLVCDVPTQFWMINLDDGFYGKINGPVVKLEEIASIPMRSLWEGFADKPWEGPPALNAKGFLSVLFEATVNPNLEPASGATQYAEKNVFLIARRFCSMRCRFGFHFLALDCFLSERDKERFIIFQFKGGAANLARRIRRVHFVAELLAQFDFATEISGDTLTARLEGGDENSFLAALRVLGYITMHTRQLDMIMGDETALAAHRFQMMEDMLALAARPPLIIP